MAVTITRHDEQGVLNPCLVLFSHSKLPTKLLLVPLGEKYRYLYWAYLFPQKAKFGGGGQFRSGKDLKNICPSATPSTKTTPSSMASMKPKGLLRQIGVRHLPPPELEKRERERVCGCNVEEKIVLSQIIRAWEEQQRLIHHSEDSIWNAALGGLGLTLGCINKRKVFERSHQMSPAPYIQYFGSYIKDLILYC